MAVVKIIELVGSSKTSTDDAARQALRAGPGHAAQHPRGRHRLDRDPRREPRRVPRPRPRRLPDRGNGGRLMAEAEERADEVVARRGAEAARRGRPAGRRARRPRVGGGPDRRRRPHAAATSCPTRIGEIDRDRPVVLYCRGGNRSDDGGRRPRRGRLRRGRSSARGSSAGTRRACRSSRRAATSPSRARPRPSSRHESSHRRRIPKPQTALRDRSETKYPNPGQVLLFSSVMEVVVDREQEAAGQGPGRHPGEPGDLRERPRPRHPDHRARVRRLRQRSREVPRRRAARRTSSSASASNRASTGSASPTSRWSGSSFPSAASRRSRWTPSPSVVEKYAPLEQGPHHDPPEHPDPPRAAARHGAAAARDRRVRALLARGLRQHDPQRHRRPLGRRRPRRGLRPDRPTPAPTSATSSATRRRS